MENDLSVLKAFYEMKSAFGQAIYEKKQERNLTYMQLEEMCNISHNYLSDIVHGIVNVSMMSMVKIAQGLEMPLSELFVRADEIIKERYDKSILK